MKVKHAFGTAVIVAVVGSGVLYLVQDNKTGELLPDEPTKQVDAPTVGEVLSEYQDSGKVVVEHKSTGTVLPNKADYGSPLPSES